MRSNCEPQSHTHTNTRVYLHSKETPPFPRDNDLLLLTYSQHFLSGLNPSIVTRCTRQEFYFGGIHSHDGMFYSPPYCTCVWSLNIESNERTHSSQGLAVSPPSDTTRSHARKTESNFSEMPLISVCLSSPHLEVEKIGSRTTGQAWFSFQLPSGFWKSSFRLDVWTLLKTFGRHGRVSFCLFVCRRGSVGSRWPPQRVSRSAFSANKCLRRAFG